MFNTKIFLMHQCHGNQEITAMIDEIGDWSRNPSQIVAGGPMMFGDRLGYSDVIHSRSAVKSWVEHHMWVEAEYHSVPPGCRLTASVIYPSASDEDLARLTAAFATTDMPRATIDLSTIVPDVLPPRSSAAQTAADQDQRMSDDHTEQASGAGQAQGSTQAASENAWAPWRRNLDYHPVPGRVDQAEVDRDVPDIGGHGQIEARKRYNRETLEPSVEVATIKIARGFMPAYVFWKWKT